MDCCISINLLVLLSDRMLTLCDAEQLEVSGQQLEIIRSVFSAVDWICPVVMWSRSIYAHGTPQVLRLLIICEIFIIYFRSAFLCFSIETYSYLSVNKSYFRIDFWNLHWISSEIPGNISTCSSSTHFIVVSVDQLSWNCTTWSISVSESEWPNSDGVVTVRPGQYGIIHDGCRESLSIDWFIISCLVIIHTTLGCVFGFRSWFTRSDCERNRHITTQSNSNVSECFGSVCLERLHLHHYRWVLHHT